MASAPFSLASPVQLSSSAERGLHRDPRGPSQLNQTFDTEYIDLRSWDIPARTDLDDDSCDTTIIPITTSGNDCMALANMSEDGALMAVWQLVAELSEQLNQNRAATAALQAQAGLLKGQAIHNGTGFVLRRFNTDLSKEIFESEVERMNAALIIENQTLQHENKQLNALLKEYEQTLDTVMSKFRGQAHAAQQHELTLTRHYESLLLVRESNALSQDLEAQTKLSASLARLSQLLRQALRANAGEDPEAEGNENDFTTAESLLAAANPEQQPGGYSNNPLSEREDWALEREAEINRLEAENAQLRKLLGIDENTIGVSEEEWNGLDHRPRFTGSLRGGPMGRKPSLMGGRGSFGSPNSSLQNQDRFAPWKQEGLLSRQ